MNIEKMLKTIATLAHEFSANNSEPVKMSFGEYAVSYLYDENTLIHFYRFTAPDEFEFDIPDTEDDWRGDLWEENHEDNFDDWCRLFKNR